MKTAKNKYLCINKFHVIWILHNVSQSLESNFSEISKDLETFYEVMRLFEIKIYDFKKRL